MHPIVSIIPLRTVWVEPHQKCSGLLHYGPANSLVYLLTDTQRPKLLNKSFGQKTYNPPSINSKKVKKINHTIREDRIEVLASAVAHHWWAKAWSNEHLVIWDQLEKDPSSRKAYMLTQMIQQHYPRQ